VVAVVEQPRLSDHGMGCNGVVGLLLGSRVSDLPEVVRRFHAAGHDVVGEGLLRVGGSRSRTGGLVARLMRLPRAVGETPVTLTIQRAAPCEPPCDQWRRSFGGEILASTQTTDGEHLFERCGPFELRFHLDITDEQLEFRHLRTRVRLGWLRVPLPRSLSPTIEASVGATPGGDELQVSVRIVGPMLGTLLSYSGRLTPQGAT
jgi:Domain of unknown function (DUF4166)